MQRTHIVDFSPRNTSRLQTTPPFACQEEKTWSSRARPYLATRKILALSPKPVLPPGTPSHPAGIKANKNLVRIHEAEVWCQLHCDINGQGVRYLVGLLPPAFARMLACRGRLLWLERNQHLWVKTQQKVTFFWARFTREAAQWHREEPILLPTVRLPGQADSSHLTHILSSED